MKIKENKDHQEKTHQEKMFRLLENVNTHQSKCELETKDNCEWEMIPVLEYPKYEYECFHCGSEMKKEGGYWENEDRYCDSCACDLFDQPKPAYDFDTIDKWFKSIEPVEVEDDVESTRLTSGYDPYEYDETYDFDSLMLRVICKICEQENVYTTDVVCPDCWKTCSELPSPQRLLPRTRSYCDDPNPDFLENKQDLRMPRVEYSWEINLWDELAKIIFGQAQAEVEPVAEVDNSMLFAREDAAFISDEEEEVEVDIVTCSICGDQESKQYSYRYKCTVYCNVCAIEHCGKIIDKPRLNEVKNEVNEVNEVKNELNEVEDKLEDIIMMPIIPYDAKLINKEEILWDSYEKIKQSIKRAVGENSITQELPNSYIIKEAHWWYEVEQVENEPHKFTISMYAPKDEIAVKYLNRRMDDILYYMDYFENPEDYQSQDETSDENEVKCLHTCDCVYDENEIHICPKYYTACKICECYISNNDMPIINEKHAVCSECLEINWVVCANCDDFSGKNMFCDKCEYKCSFAKQCLKCNYNDMPTIFDYKMNENNTKKLLCCGRCYKSLQCLDCYCFTDYKLREEQCFECHFKKELRPQKPLEDHLQKIIAMQRVPSKQFGILLEYAALCEFTIFEAYQYKSQCHWPGCKIEIQPRLWDANEQVQFCCYKHYELFEDFEVHDRFDDINEEYDCVTCKACKSPHSRNKLQRH